ncbi:hypothetical protein L1887_23376 [Cichorium endivia]|nr:hypothetical protein L1887_23376 [Cichorium endivia]
MDSWRWEEEEEEEEEEVEAINDGKEEQYIRTGNPLPPSIKSTYHPPRRSREKPPPTKPSLFLSLVRVYIRSRRLATSVV